MIAHPMDPTEVGHAAASYDLTADLKPLWTRDPVRWRQHTDAFRHAYRTAYEEVAGDE